MINNPLDIQHSFIVQAPAGSGKTSLLTQRLLALLATVENPEECLCLTFTRKAAAEMRSRVLQALSLAAEKSSTQDEHEKLTRSLAEQVLKRDKALEWNLMDYPNRLQIQTIDALCANLAQSMPLTSGLGAAQNLIERPDSFYREAATQLLKRVENASATYEDSVVTALLNLLSHCDNDWEAVANLLAEMLAKRDQWLLALGNTFFKVPDKEKMEQGLINAIEETQAFVMQTLPPQEIANELFQLMNFASTTSITLSETSETHGETQKSKITQWPSRRVEDFSQWLSIAEFLLTDADEWRKTVTQKQGFPAASSAKTSEEKQLFKMMKDRMQELLCKLQDYPEFGLSLKYIRECPPTQYTEEQWNMIQALLQVLPHLVAELILLFQKNNQVDFIEIALRAHQALGEVDAPTDLNLQLGNRLKHILVDEFQDTSIAQYVLLEKLTANFSEHEGNTLFFVGDPQQSIYRFRRAEVSLFIQAKRQGMNDIKLIPLTLTKNYRSTQTVIDWVNKTFSKLFPKTEDHVLGAIPYISCEAGHIKDHGISKQSPDFSQVVFQTVNEQDEVAQLIQCLKQIQTQDPQGSIAILVRSRSHLKSIIPALINSNIAYQGIELDALENRPIIRDLLIVARCLIHLSDRIAWLSLLRAPFCNIALKDIEIIAQYKPELPILASLQMSAQIADLSSETHTILARIVPILNETMNQCGRVSLVKLIKTSYEQLTQDKLENTEEVQTFFNLCRDAEHSQEIYQMGWFEEKIKTQYMSATVSATAVSATVSMLSSGSHNEQGIQLKPIQIMTIHKAKGLEFDSVLLPGLGRREMYDSSQILLWEERRAAHGASYLLLAPIKSAKIKQDPIYEFLRKQTRKRTEFENLRLLYVAATRAKKRLYGFSYSDTYE